MEELLTIREIGHELKVATGHIYRLISRNMLDAVNISPGSSRPTLRVTRNSLVKFLETEGKTRQPAKINLDMPAIRPTVSGIRKLRKRNSIRAGESYLPLPPDQTAKVPALLSIGNSDRHDPPSVPASARRGSQEKPILKIKSKGE